MPELPDRRLLVLFAIKLVQPGMLRDVTEGLTRLLPVGSVPLDLKSQVHSELEALLLRNVVCLYAGRRYMLTSEGESIVEESGIRQKIEARRMFLLKETRKDMKRARSDTRDRSLQQ